MSLKYRELKLKDILAIRELSRDLRVSPNLGEIAEAWIKDPDCHFYGAFKGKKLVGVGSLRKKSADLAWLEGIRVHLRHQHQGIGTELFNFGVELSRDLGYKSVGYTTEATNRGSCRIGEILGFQRLSEMEALYCKPISITFDSEDFLDQSPLPIEEALDLLAKIPNGPRDEICMGWNFAPLEQEFFEKNEQDMKFYVSGNAVSLEYNERNPVTNEVEFVKCIVYGSKDGAHDLLSGFVSRNAERVIIITCLCPKDLVSVAQDVGFFYGTIPQTIVLFKKIFPSV